MKKDPSHRQCVSMVVLRKAENTQDYEILIVHKPRKNDAWQIAQGGIEEGESIEEAAKRELEEETGIILGDAPLTLCKQFYQYDYPEGFKRAEKPKYDGQHLSFVCAIVPRDTVVTVDQRELDDFRWIAVNELGNFLKRKEYRDTVVEILESME